MGTDYFGTLCLFGTSGPTQQVIESIRCNKGLEGTVKKIALALVVTVTALSLGGCFVGKGKAPAPIATRG